MRGTLAAIIVIAVTVTNSAQADCPRGSLHLLIFPDGRAQFDHGEVLGPEGFRSGIREMARSHCPPYIVAKGAPPAVNGILDEFRSAGYDMSKIIFH